MKRFLILILVAIFFSGCRLVTINSPIGEESVKIIRTDWEGIWYDGENSVLFISVTDIKNSVLNVKAVENSSGALKVKEFSVILKKGSKMIFASIPFAEIADEKEINDNTKDLYFWGYIKKSERKILFFSPDGDMIGDLIEEGKLKGKTDKGYVYLSSPAREILRIVETEMYGVIFDWQNPIILRKID